jgi:hypothetical protein
MRTDTAQAFFGGRRANLAKALHGIWSASAVYLWKGVVPLAAAKKLSEITKGELQVVEELYDERGSIASVSDKILKPPKEIKPKVRRRA